MDKWLVTLVSDMVILVYWAACRVVDVLNRLEQDELEMFQEMADDGSEAWRTR